MLIHHVKGPELNPSLQNPKPCLLEHSATWLVFKNCDRRIELSMRPSYSTERDPVPEINQITTTKTKTKTVRRHSDASLWSQKAEKGDGSWSQDQPRVCSEFQASLSHIARLKKKKIESNQIIDLSGHKNTLTPNTKTKQTLLSASPSTGLSHHIHNIVFWHHIFSECSDLSL